MKILLALLTLSFVSSAHALSKCETDDGHMKITVVQAGSDLSMQLVESKFSKNSEIKDTEVLEQEAVNFIIKNTQLEQLEAKRDAITKALVSGLFQMRVMDGEYDMVWSYASGYARNLKCQ
ncbi:hypothetical protein [Bdellovibrio sp. NC01]|uniref:hypothetical protein n=1 Tax=Bdellovibrio sp. NC01 TaxID=2220073 RepID=UPI0011574ED6|nr:hypothetical protein [Bdellovibrio sp. NC01]QDK36724.1 hypothetical protein DOE51_03455 [Bdellovibrio sp. NC01]